MKTLRNAMIGLAALICLLAAAVVMIIRTQWFRDEARKEIVKTIQQDTGGRVEIGSFDFAAAELRVHIGNLVIHGSEPATAVPFLRVRSIDFEAHLLTGGQMIDIAYLAIDRPQMNVLIAEDGSTNVPTPKPGAPSKTTPLETVVDLAIGQFKLRQGEINLNSRKEPLDIQASNLHAQLWYHRLDRNYQGLLSLDAATPTVVKLTLPVVLDRDRIRIQDASIATTNSRLRIDGSIENLRQPKYAAKLSGVVALSDLPIRNVNGSVSLEADVTGSDDSIRVLSARAALGHSTLTANGVLKGPLETEKLKFEGDVSLADVAALTATKGMPSGSLQLRGDAKLDANNQYHVAAAVNSHLRYAPYAAAISGNVDLDAQRTTADLNVAAMDQRVPIRGQLHAAYYSAQDNLVLHNSYLSMPHTKATFEGSLERRIDVTVNTSDVHDLLATAPVTLQGGQATFKGAVNGVLQSPRITGHLGANHFQVSDRAFDSLDVDVSAGASGAAINNGSLTRGAMKATFSGRVGLRDWNAASSETIAASANVLNADVADIAAMAGIASQGYSGALNANLQVAGTIGNPTGAADLHVANGALDGHPFDRLDAQARMSDRLAVIPFATLVSGTSRADLTAEFHHPRDSFKTGGLHAHLATNAFNLTTVRRDISGQGRANLDVGANLDSSEFLVTSLEGDASARQIRYQGQDYGDVGLQAHTNGQTVALNLTSNFAGSKIALNGSARLIHGYPATADANVSNLPIERVLAVAQRSDIPARGKLSAVAHVQGTLENPEGNATLDLSSAVLYQERIDHARMRVTYLQRSIEVPELYVTEGPSHLALTARFDHPAGSFDSGNLQFRINKSRVDLAHIKNVQSMAPGVAGLLQISADGSAALHTAAPRTAAPRILLTSLNADVGGSQLAENGKSLGRLDLMAHTASGNHLDFRLESNLAGSNIQADGNAELSGNYPVNAHMTLGNVRWSKLAPLVGQTTTGSTPFDAITEGSASIEGPVLDPQALQGTLQLSKLDFTAQSITIRNQGPITASLDHGIARIDSLHLIGPKTDIQASGSFATSTKAINARLNAALDLSVADSFDRDLSSSGSVSLTASVSGTESSPHASGKVDLHDASIFHADFSNGIAHANGTILLEGNRATIQKLTAQSGGGNINLTGFATLGDNPRFFVDANATRIRVRVQEGVSLIAGANLRLSGTESTSTVSGNVTIDQLNYATKSDLGSILQRASPPVQNAATPTPLLDNMKLDIRVRTSSAMRVQTSLAENLQPDADLRVRGTASQPSVLGRVDLTEGRLVFFGSTYNINTGTIAFYNPVRIEPILNLSLETQSQGVDVVLNVTGPVENMKLTYTSDPPLQFQEIVSLLAAGTTPTSDPTILANQPTPPPQTFEQMGESAVMGQAVADPIATRLQRVFGVSQLKINPTFAGSSQLPTAQVSLTQQISSNITFTYVTAIDDPNSTLIRAEWALNSRWSALAVRDQNGIFSVNLLYKREFR